MANLSGRFEIVMDNSGHTYIIPVEMYNDWASFTMLDEDDEASWEAPTYAQRVEGRLTFTDPRCD